jgi:hypothetical protein
LYGGSRFRHFTGWALIVFGICLLWLWQNFPETFGGNIDFFHYFTFEISLIPFIAGVVCVIIGALLASGGWSSHLLGVQYRYVVGILLVAAVASTVRPTDMTNRADTWVAFQTLRPSLDAIYREVPRGLTSMECDFQRNDGRNGNESDPGCKEISETRIARRSPTEDSLYSAITDAEVRGFFDIEVRPSHVAIVRIVPSPGVRQGFLKVHESNNSSALPQELFRHPLTDLYPLEGGWFHFVTH